MDGKVRPKFIFAGDPQLARRYCKAGLKLMHDLEHMMSFQDLAQCRLKREVAPGVTVQVDKRFGLRTIVIQADGEGGEQEKWLAECFANATCALAYVLDVVGIVAGEPADCVAEPVCQTCIGANTFPYPYYCTYGIRYNVAVCDGTGEYVYCAAMPSSDYTPRCPGEQVLVMQNRTYDLPAEVLAIADNNPWAKHPFTRKLATIQDSISILPHNPEMLRRREYRVEE